jgi:MFS transporter, DHA1 family, inner membrane transport protein
MRRSVVILVVLALSSFTWAINFGVLIPLITLIAQEFGKSDAAVGQLATIYGIATTLTALVMAPLIDQLGRGRLLRIAVLLVFTGTAATALAPGFFWLFPARAITGLGTALMMPVLFATAGDLYDDQLGRSRAIGMISAATGLAPLLGIPALTQIADFAGWRWSASSVLVPLALVWFASHLLPSKVTGQLRLGGSAYLQHYRRVLNNRETNWLLAGHLARSIPWYSALLFLGAFGMTAYGMSANQLSLLFIVLGGTFFVAMNVAPIALRFLAPRRLYTIGVIILFANFTAVGIWNNMWSLFVFVVVLSFAGAGLSISEGLLLLESHPDARGGIMSLRSANVEFGTAAGAGLIGLLLVLFADYGMAYRLLGMLIPIGLVALYMSTRSAGQHGLPADQSVPDVAAESASVS